MAEAKPCARRLKRPDFRELLSIPQGASGMEGNGRGSNERICFFFILGEGFVKCLEPAASFSGGWAIFLDLTSTSSGLSLVTSGCNADRVVIEWEANRGYVLTTYPEDLEADWPPWYGTCRASWQGLLFSESLPSLQSTFGCGSFQTCSRGGSACEILESFVLDTSTIDAFYASDCTEGQLSESARTTLQEYLAKEPDNTQKTMFLSSDCAKGFVAYKDDYCLSIDDALSYCWGEVRDQDGFRPARRIRPTWSTRGFSK